MVAGIAAVNLTVAVQRCAACVKSEDEAGGAGWPLRTARQSRGRDGPSPPSPSSLSLPLAPLLCCRIAPYAPMLPLHPHHRTAHPHAHPPTSSPRLTQLRPPAARASERSPPRRPNNSALAAIAHIRARAGPLHARPHSPARAPASSHLQQRPLSSTSPPDPEDNTTADDRLAPPRLAPRALPLHRPARAARRRRTAGSSERRRVVVVVVGANETWSLDAHGERGGLECGRGKSPSSCLRPRSVEPHLYERQRAHARES